MNQHKIIMNYTTPPSHEDLESLAADVFKNLPDELLEQCEAVTLEIEDFADETILSEAECDDPYELLALYKSGQEISPGVRKKVANDDDVLILFRRPILDLWCETQDDLAGLMRDVMVEELGRNFDFSEDDIEEMSQRHHQGMF